MNKSIDAILFDRTLSRKLDVVNTMIEGGVVEGCNRSHPQAIWAVGILAHVSLSLASVDAETGMRSEYWRKNLA